MLIDLHAHYPMHIYPKTRFRFVRRFRARRRGSWRVFRSRQGDLGLGQRLQALLIGLFSLIANYRSVLSGPRVRMKYMRMGGVGVGLSVLHLFFDEVDVKDGFAPKRSYLKDLEDQIATVEGHVEWYHPDEAEVVHNPTELATARRAGKLALVHCVEGGYHLGPTPEDIEHSIGMLAEAGVAYITLAHLFWREIATNAPALPFLKDREYREVFPQPRAGLSALGQKAVSEMHRHRILVDLSHMSKESLDDTFELLRDLDRDSPETTPVIATHAGYRFGDQDYMLERRTVERVAERGGLIGLIFAQHQLFDGLTDEKMSRFGRPLRRRRRFDDAIWVLRQHIDRIHEITGSHEHTALGSDFDGFIKPTLPKLDDMRDMAPLERALHSEYGEQDADAICSGNALRLLNSYWRGGPGLGPD
jgi:membrane dipeptidase